MSKYLMITLILLSIVAFTVSFMNYSITQQDTYYQVGIVSLECLVRGEDVVVVLKNTHDKLFVVLGIETTPKKVVGIISPQLLRPKNTTYFLLEGVGELSKVLVFLLDPETNTSLVMACVS
ncbi:MAG: hypothetical protein QN229_05980 [Desulfurococcaceae archaeon TW002]